MKRRQMTGMLIATFISPSILELPRGYARPGITMINGALTQTDAKTVAADVMRAARIAHGGESGLRAVTSLSATGSFREVVQGGVERAGDLELNFLLPDRYMRIESWSLGGDVRPVRMINSLDAEQAWFGSGDGGDSTQIIVAGGGGSDRQTLAALEKQAQQQLLERLRSESSRLLLAWVMSPTVGGLPLEFSYVGVAKAEDGEADVIDARTTTASFAARLFFDKQTHRLLMLSYRGRAPRALALKPGSSGDIKKALNTSDSELQLRFADYRTVSGIQLPHLITHAADNQDYQEWRLKSFKVNPSLKPEKFRKKS